MRLLLSVVRGSSYDDTAAGSEGQSATTLDACGRTGEQKVVYGVTEAVTPTVALLAGRISADFGFAGPAQLFLDGFALQPNDIVADVLRDNDRVVARLAKVAVVGKNQATFTARAIETDQSEKQIQERNENPPSKQSESSETSNSAVATASAFARQNNKRPHLQSEQPSISEVKAKRARDTESVSAQDFVTKESMLQQQQQQQQRLVSEVKDSKAKSCRIIVTAVDCTAYPPRKVEPSVMRQSLATHAASDYAGCELQPADEEKQTEVAQAKGVEQDNEASDNTTLGATQPRKTRRGNRRKRDPEAHQDTLSTADTRQDAPESNTIASEVSIAVADKKVEKLESNEKEKNYSKCAKLTPEIARWLTSGTRLAFKRMELSESCTPQISERHVEGTVRSCVDGRISIMVDAQPIKTPTKPAARAQQQRAGRTTRSQTRERAAKTGGGGGGGEWDLDYGDDETTITKANGLSKFLTPETAQTTTLPEIVNLRYQDLHDAVILSWGGSSTTESSS